MGKSRSGRYPSHPCRKTLPQRTPAINRVWRSRGAPESNQPSAPGDPARAPRIKRPKSSPTKKTSRRDQDKWTWQRNREVRGPGLCFGLPMGSMGILSDISRAINYSIICSDLFFFFFVGLIVL